jgi:hypothetical protein
MAIIIVPCIISSQSQAREMTVLSYEELLDKSDLVVIAIPVSKTADTMEVEYLSAIWLQDKIGQQKIKAIGVDTVFAVSAILKGKSGKTFTLHHYRQAQAPAVEINGPSLVFFDPADSSKLGSYLLFLVREPTGMFAPTGGQTDPGFKSITRLPFEPTK